MRERQWPAARKGPGASLRGRAQAACLGLLLAVGGRLAPAQIVADHAAVAAFERIPDEALTSAAGLRLLFRHASVGGTIHNALDCLQGTRESPAVCTTFPDYRYDRRAWSFQARGNLGWYGKVDDFVAEVEANFESFDVFAFKYCYLDGLDGLMEPCGSTLDPAKVEAAWSYLRSHMDALQAAHPEKTFLWWTIPLTQVGQECTEVLNARIREYAGAERKILFDIADIESHDDAGAHNTNDRGWEVAIRALCGEQKPDAQACHPNWDGSLRLAKAHWWLMARVSGWEEGTASVPFVRGDANADGGVDVTDAVFVLSYLFRSGPPPPCSKAADANDDGAVDVADPVRVLGFIFGLGWVLAEPAAACGPDPTDDALACPSFEPCG